VDGHHAVGDQIRDEMVAVLPRLRRFARSITWNDDACDELLQATVERTLASIDHFRQGARLESWMYRIAQNIWIDGKRTRRRQGMTVPIEQIAYVPGEDGRRVADARLMLGEMGAALTALPADQRHLILLVAIDGCSYRDASKRLNIPVGTVMSRLARARAALRDAVIGDEF
jgi:RNA polymerase sigma-70 factor (ECF subfamily)